MYSTASIPPGAMSNETGSEYEANPGAMQIYKGFKEVSQFSTADPNAFLEPFKQLVLSIATTTGTPLWKFSGIGAQTPSGEMLKIAESPLVQHALDLMPLLGAPYEGAYEFALRLLGITATVKISWANPATSDLMEIWQLVKAKIELGVPRDVAFMQAGVSEAEAAEWAKTYDDVFATAEYYQGRAQSYLAQAELYKQQAIAAAIANGVPQEVALVDGGYDEAEVRAWFADKAQELALSRRIQLFGQLTTGMQALGMAVGMEIIDKGGANQIIMNLLSELIPEVPSIELEVDDEEDEPDPAALPPGFGAPPQPGDERLPTEGAPGPGGQVPITSALPAGTPPVMPMHDNPGQ
jgi:hypothetical protein